MSEVTRYDLAEDSDGIFDVWPVPPRMEGRFVKHEDYAALQQHLDVLLSEGIELRKFIRDSCYAYNGDGSDISDAYTPAEESPLFPKSADSDAILNAVRAEGAEQASGRIRNLLSAIKEQHHGVVNECADVAQDVARKFRADATKGGSDD